MTTIKEAKIKIFSVIENLDEAGLSDGDAEKNESVAVGYLHCFDTATLITYAEKQEGASVTSEIKCEDGCVRVVRRGAIESDMLFSEGEIHTSVYTVAPYSFDSEIFTRKIRNSITDKGGRLDLLYDMKIGGASKRCRMSIDVCPS